MPRKTPISSAEPPAPQRLHDALAEMLRQQDAGQPPGALTAKALCQSAGISRNALYRYHRDVLLALHEAQRRHRDRPEVAKRVAAQLRRENRELREHLAKLAALVDHYFAAWQETRLQLERRDRELADLRRAHKPQVVSLGR
jgi:AcrR family transcriptional regulator